MEITVTLTEAQYNGIDLLFKSWIDTLHGEGTRARLFQALENAPANYDLDTDEYVYTVSLESEADAKVLDKLL